MGHTLRYWHQQVKAKLTTIVKNQKFSINTQVVIGANLIFLDVTTGFPGSIYDSRMLRSSELYRKCEEPEILSKPEKIN